MARHFLTLDFETYYADDYSLSQKGMTPASYILDPRYETIMCAAKVDGGPSEIIDGPDFGNWLTQFDPTETTTCTFNALFDNCILAWQYGFVPSRMYCAMRMAAALRGHLLQSVSLTSVCRFFHLPPKGTMIANVKGMRRQDIRDHGLWSDFTAYCKDDADRCQDIFNILFPEFPSAERRIMDRVLRCAVEPRFQVDTDMLRQHLVDLRVAKVAMLKEAGAQVNEQDPPAEQDKALEAFAKTLRSNGKFEEVLKAHGVDVEYKQSLTAPDRQIPQFAKTDEFMAELQEHEDPAVQALACARLGLRSTIEETRGQRILDLAMLPWHCYRDGSPRMYTGGTLPIPLRYAAAHTQRLGGDWKINMQNLPSGRGTQKSKLRKSLIAPPNHKVVVADLAQIECRINAWICGQQDLLDVFAAKGDPYSILASSIFEFPVDKKIHLTERFIGKSGELGLGFGCAGPKFYNMVVRQARVLGMDVKKLLTVWTPELAHKSVRTYRTTHGAIVGAWDRLKVILNTAWVGLSDPVRFGPCVIGRGYVEGPGGLRMNYEVVSKDPDDLRYAYGKRVHRIYGSYFLENIVQFLARIVVMNAALRIGNRTKRNFVLQAHDELAWIVPDAEVASFMAIVGEEMVRRPSWAPDLPLNYECKAAQSYGDAK